MPNVALRACLVSDSPIKQKEYQMKISPFFCNSVTQEHRFVTQHILSDELSFTVSGKKYSAATCFPIFSFLTYVEKQWCWLQWTK